MNKIKKYIKKIKEFFLLHFYQEPIIKKIRDFFLFHFYYKPIIKKILRRYKRIPPHLKKKYIYVLYRSVLLNKRMLDVELENLKRKKREFETDSNNVDE